MEKRDFHGTSFALCCLKCGENIDEMLDRLNSMYGGFKGGCGPMGSPKILSLEQLKQEVVGGKR